MSLVRARIALKTKKLRSRCRFRRAPFDYVLIMNRDLVLRMSVSADGFVCGPNGEMDWMLPTMSDEGREWLAASFGRVGLIAIGRRSYQDMAGYWLTSSISLARPMNEIPKAVFSKTGTAEVPAAVKDATGVDEAARQSWMNPTVMGTDLVADVQRLKAEGGKPVMAIGGASFAASLVAANLVDELLLSVHPVAIGQGRPLFADIEAPVHLVLKDLKKFDSGVVAKVYRPA